MSSIKSILAPSVLPVTLVTAMRSLRVLQGDADLVELYLAAATEKVEDYTGRALVTQTFLLQLEAWPSKDLTLELRRTPLASVTSIKYYPEDGSAQATLDANRYRVNTNATPGFVEFVDTVDPLPSLATRADAVEVTFIAGYGTTEDTIPPLLRAAVLQMARNYYDNRLPVGDAKIVEMPLSVRDILRSQRVESLTPLL
jgi:uncharacterized phiE125 gp8 family phage protein